MQVAHKTEITSGVNEGRFIAHLRELFSSSTVALSELAQNARRAQATKVVFDLSEDGRTLVVTDNGIGIDDFQKLIVVAESGWSDELMADEQPFGIGFASVSFCAESVLVESKGKSVSFTTEDLVAKRPIPVSTASFIGGTRLTLSGFKVDINKAKEALRSIAKGFPIPVVVNGEELPRPHAKALLQGEETAIGFVRVPGVHSDKLDAFEFKGHVYCQGLPVKAGEFTRSHHRSEDSVVLHIDHHQFKPRCPDRDSLIDADVASQRITDLLKALMREHLNRLKGALSSDDFANSYWKIATSINALDIMNDVPVLPRSVMWVITESLRQSCDGGNCWGMAKYSVTRAQVETGEVVLFDQDLCDEFEADNFARMAFVSAKDWHQCDPLPKGHWANAHIKEIDKLDCVIGGKIIAEGYFDGDYVSGGTSIVEDLSVTMAGETVLLTESIAIDMTEGVFDGLLVPVNCEYPSSVLLQASTYTSGDGDHYEESSHDADIREFNNFIAMLRGESPEKTLEKCLRSSSVHSRTNLRGKAFSVVFDQAGKFSVITQ
jgi:hypothetical protein